MAAVAASDYSQSVQNGHGHHISSIEDPFMEDSRTMEQPHVHRFSSRFDVDHTDLGSTSSPSQMKRILEAHLIETERRLQDTHKLGTSLLEQQAELQHKLQEVEQQQDDAEISPELKQRLASLGREHDDVSREIARSLLAPKSAIINAEDATNGGITTFTSQATGSPTKLSAPNRRSRNQPKDRAEDLQFAADITTSLLAQVRQLQSAVAERDEALKTTNTERLQLEQDIQLFAQKLQAHDEHEQKYKDENWNLQAQNHELLSAHREVAEREKRLNAAVTLANAEKTRLISEIEESKLAQSRAVEDRDATKKAHETEIHSLKRDFDAADLDRSTLQSRVDELTAQNQELARGMTSRFRNQSPEKQINLDVEDEAFDKDLSTPEHSPPPSPTKATPRHGGLESETLKSSLHHAHRMIQNLKSNIHREKTEKIELKRMLQDARDELEQRRNETGIANVAKKQRTRNEPFKKPPRPDMLGNSRRTRTDIELQDNDWEDQTHETSRHPTGLRLAPPSGLTDFSDAYQTAHETESNFETADENQTTESEAFETGSESLAGDSSEDLTETESTAPGSLRHAVSRHNRPSLGFRSANNRDSYLSTASTSAGEEDDLQTPIQPFAQRFKLKNRSSSSARNTQIFEGTPDSVRTQSSTLESPATITDGRSPPSVEQSLFAELEGIHDNSSTFSTPAKSGHSSLVSSPGISQTPSKVIPTTGEMPVSSEQITTDRANIREIEEAADTHAKGQADVKSNLANERAVPGTESTIEERGVSIGDFPLPPSTSSSPIESIDKGTQYTPQRRGVNSVQSTPSQSGELNREYTPSRFIQESPMRPGNTFITPPKTVWDQEHNSEIGSPGHDASAPIMLSKASLGYSDVFAQGTTPMSPARTTPAPASTLGYSMIFSQQTHPIAPPPSLPPTGPLPAIPHKSKQDRLTPEKSGGPATGGILAGAAAALGLNWAVDRDSSTKDTDEARIVSSRPDSRQPLQDITGNVQSTGNSSVRRTDSATKVGSPLLPEGDQNEHHISTTDDIDQTSNSTRHDSMSTAKLSTSPKSQIETQSPFNAASPELSKKSSFSGSLPPTSPPLRPASASSHRASMTTKQHPPLPSDYKSNIERANSLVHNGSVRKESAKQVVSSVMGPPLMPASAMRRSKTPVDSTRSPSRDNATPRAGTSTRQRGNTETQVSRRSSMSSFVSEVDERFGMRTGPAGDRFMPSPGTDPRMIQAITQTMIGEYLWKYTRKAGGKEMSMTRHKRYFWVHPYTKTLYWSNVDPSVPGAKESTSRSVPIESVRIVPDDNPMPPGLHRKSLEVTTPSRKLKFTASTSQRHETWFNALSYLLLRVDTPQNYATYSAGETDITRDDVEEFRASAFDPRLAPVSRQSMSSYNSRGTTGTSKRIAGAAGTGMRQSLPSNIVSTSSGTLRHQGSVSRDNSMPPPAASGRVSRAESTREVDRNRTIRATSVSRVSRMLGSITGRSSRQVTHEQGAGQAEFQQSDHSRGPSRQSNSIYDASLISQPRDSAEETRNEMLNDEAKVLGSSRAGLENVRACCDGKHDVSTLSHSHRPEERHRTLSSMSDRLNRSTSKRV